MAQQTSLSDKIFIMIKTLNKWLDKHDYLYWSCNYVPPSLFSSRFRKWNVFIRTFFRLCPINFRRGNKYPTTPQANVAFLKALTINPENHKERIREIFERIKSLKSSKANNFALKQGIIVANSMYVDSPEDPSPLNTVWLGLELLKDDGIITNKEERDGIILSIAKYLVEELGYDDFGEKGVYFHYGVNLSKIIYNASAFISSFLIKVGERYRIEKYYILGSRGISFIISRQNEDGSWFYSAPPSRPSIDCFHQSYILQAIIESEKYLKFSVSENIDRGIRYYKTLFHDVGKEVIPERYDRRYPPGNTWKFVKVDGRDIVEGIIFFSKYCQDRHIVEGLVNYLYSEFYNKKSGYFAPELFVYGKNHIPYIEFQAWFLYALQFLRSYR